MNTKVAKRTALSVPERVSRALRSVERASELVELAGRSTHITAITNPDGRQQVHGALMALKNERIAITNESKAARDDAVKFQKACIAEEDRLIKLIKPEEDRLQTLRDDWDADREREKQAAIEIEQRRVADLQERVAELHGSRSLSVLSGSALIAEHIGDVERIAVDDSFQEFRETAEVAKAEGLKWLSGLHATAVAHETEQARIKADREELERLRQQEADRQAADRTRLAKIRRAIDAVRNGYVINAKSSPEDILEQRHIHAAIVVDTGRFQELLPEAEEAHAAALRALDEAYDSAVRREAQEAEASRLAAQRAELERVEREQREARDAEDRRIAADRAEVERQQEELRLAQERASPIADPEPVDAASASDDSPTLGPVVCGTPWRPSVNEIAQVIAGAYDVELDTARDWLIHSDFDALQQQAAA